MSTYISEAFREFSKKLKKFNEASDARRVEKKTENVFLQENLNDRAERLKNNVVETYRIYKSPFEVLGTDSSRASSIDNDEQELLKAYNLYKGVMDLNIINQDEIGATYIKDADIYSPLAQKAVYVSGGQFVYLFAWLVFEKGCNEYIPFFDGDDGRKRLRFSRTGAPNPSIHDEEILRIIKTEFYS